LVKFCISFGVHHEKKGSDKTAIARAGLEIEEDAGIGGLIDKLLKLICC
jgi:hypothetical protein